MSVSLKILVGIASAGRRDLLSAALLRIADQSRQPDLMVICLPHDESFAPAFEEKTAFLTQIVFSEKGLTKQRNAILEAGTGFDVLVFFDDDFVPAITYLDHTEGCFLRNEDVVAASGFILADGINGRGIELQAAEKILAEDRVEPGSGDGAVERQYNAYGCNMALRLAPVRKHKLRFDERLPLYGWLEDVDFCRQLAPFGRIVKDYNLRGVHLGTKVGRTSGVRFGYSQIANPIYLWKKGTLRFDRAVKQMSKNVASNLGKSLAPEPWVDRNGRLQGNLRAIADLLRGRLDPRKITEFHT